MKIDYQLLDSGNLQKLEQVGPYRLVRPALNAFWRPSLPESEWKKADGVFVRDATGGGKWTFHKPLPESWEIAWGGFVILVKPTNFGHLGFFAEQYENWDFFRRFIPTLDDDAAALNLFGYSGIGSMAMAEAGAKTTHLDASKGMIDWGRKNIPLNAKVPDTIRWIADDVIKFVGREIRRGAKYNLIAMDPPTFGRGSSGQVWKIEEHLPKLLRDCREIMDLTRPHAIILSCHSPGFSPLVMERLLHEVFGSHGAFESQEMIIPEAGGRRALPAGICTKYFCRVCKP